jgi:hypothetical protein
MKCFDCFKGINSGPNVVEWVLLVNDPWRLGFDVLTFITNLWVAIMIHYEMHFYEALSLCNKCFKQCWRPINLTQIAFHAMSSWMQIIIVILHVIINSDVHNESHTLTLGLWPRLGQDKDNKLGNVQNMTTFSWCKGNVWKCKEEDPKQSNELSLWKLEVLSYPKFLDQGLGIKLSKLRLL